MSRPATEKIPYGELPGAPVQVLRGTLEIVEGPGASRRVELTADRSLHVGSAAGNDLVLPDSTVSAQHLLISPGENGFKVRDRGSTNGTYVDGVRVDEATLRPGSELRAGRTVMRFTTGAEQLLIAPSTRGSFGALLGTSPRMRSLFGLLERIAPTDTTVLIESETGTGKELLARSIHDHSRRAKARFAVFDCARASREFMESELFGHEKGAFTGAVDRREGAFAEADGGTLFIDELGELSRELQPKLLRALEEREVRPLGANRARPVDVRVLAATHRDLESMVREGRFREDLYFRLAVFKVTLPPLRERREDVPLLARALLERRGGGVLTEAALQVLTCQTWRGNVRELSNVIERAAALAAGEPLEPRHLMLADGSSRAGPPGAAGGLAGKTLGEIEREAIRQTLQATGNNKAATARSLGIASSTLFEKMKRHGLS